MQALRTQLRHLATFDTLGNPHVPTVLLHGETGTGKGLVAHVLHASGPRARGPFVAINCAAIPETLLEAELFGFEAGAFSEARRAKPGLLEAASGGSLFLDEIDALPGLLQGKLLTALEAKRVRRLGAVVEHTVDVKVIVATQAALSEQVAAGRFRADLYHRLAVVVLELPPLRARQEDMLELAQAFLQRYAAAHGLPPKQLSPMAETWLQGYDWPGNVRELSHLMERVTLLSTEATLMPETLERLVLPRVGPTAPHTAGPAASGGEAGDEIGRMRQALEESRGNVVQAARQLGMSRSAFRYRMQRYGLAPPRVGDLPRVIRPVAVTPLQTEGQGGAPRGEAPPPAPETAPPLPPVGGPVGERKLVTVLCGTVGPAAPRARALATVAPRVVAQYGGLLLPALDETLLAVFGLPVAHEDHAQQAVLAALRLQEALGVPAGGVGPGEVGTVRLGIHTGVVATGDLTAGEPLGTAVVGEALTQAMALQACAAPGTILCSAATARLVRGLVRVTAMGGAPSPGDVYQIRGQRPAGVSGRSRLLRPFSPFVGRAHELATLHALLAQAAAGQGQVVGIIGEPGLGKSRLVTEFRRSLPGRRLTYLAGHCLAYRQATPYGPVLELLRQACRLTAADPPATITRKVGQRLAEVGIAPEDGAPYVLTLLGVRPDPDALAQQSPQAVRARTIALLVQLALQEAHQRLLVLEVENLHWCDPSSAEVLMALVERLAGTALLLLTTYRPEYRPPWLDKSYATQVTLTRLPAADSRRIAQAVLGPTLVAEALVQAIITRAGGNPLFVEELARTVVEAGAGQLPEAVPATLEGVLAARLDRLPPAAKHVAQVAAVIGAEVPGPLLQAVLGWPEAVMQASLAHLQATELLYETRLVPTPVYTFKHVLTQEAAYQALLPRGRQALHGQIAQVLEEHFPKTAETQPELLAHHYTEAGLAESAVAYWQRAGKRTKYAGEREAVVHFSKGLEVLQTLPDTPVRTQQELDLLIDLGIGLGNTKGAAAPEVAQVWDRARTLCQHMEDTSHLFRVLTQLRTVHTARAEHQTARDFAEQALALAQHLQRPGLLVPAHYSFGVPLLHLGDMASARGHFEQAIVHYDARRGGPQAGFMVQALGYVAQTLWVLGYPDRALQRHHEALAMLQQWSHPGIVHEALYNASGLHWLRREVQAVHERTAAALALASEHGSPPMLALLQHQQGWVLAARGRYEEGIAQMRQSLATLRTMGEAVGRPRLLALLAEAYGKSGQAKEGLRLLAEALVLMDNTGERQDAAEVHRLKGELLLWQAVPDAPQAEACFQQALAIARQQQAKSLELRAAMSLARLWQRQGKHAEARALLAPIYGWFTEGFDTADLQEASALLGEL
jgi:transcriptional regulator with AAA-type ATPase domain/predicted ATPase